MMWKCAVCSEEFAFGGILDHIRLMHPERVEVFDKWPDGEPVIYEDADEFFL